MSSPTDRIERFYRTLSAVDRTRILLRSPRDGHGPGALLFRTVPAAQRQEFQRVLGLALGRRRELLTYIALLEGFVAQFRMRVLYFRDLQVRAVQREMLRIFLGTIVPEPITDDDYRRLQEARERGAAPCEGAGADPYDGRRVGQPVGRSVTDLRSTRDVPRMIAMRRLVRAVNPAAFDPAEESDEVPNDVLDDSSVLTPEAAAYFEIYPNTAAAEVASMRGLLDKFVAMAAGKDEGMPEARVDELSEELQWLWRELKCVELANERLAKKELRGDSPLADCDRKRLQEMLDLLLEARDVLQVDGLPVELTDPDQMDVFNLADGHRYVHGVVVDVSGEGMRVRLADL